MNGWGGIENFPDPEGQKSRLTAAAILKRSGVGFRKLLEMNRLIFKKEMTEFWDKQLQSSYGLTLIFFARCL